MISFPKGCFKLGCFLQVRACSTRGFCFAFGTMILSNIPVQHKYQTILLVKLKHDEGLE